VTLSLLAGAPAEAPSLPFSKEDLVFTTAAFFFFVVVVCHDSAARLLEGQQEHQLSARAMSTILPLYYLTAPSSATTT
jgi:hypothetical protein